jgi:hypothetical protein
MKTSVNTIILTTTTIVPLNTGANDISPFSKASYQLVWDYTLGGDSAGNVTLQTSDDGVNFVNYPSAVVPFTSTSLSDMFEFTSIGIRWCRLNFDIVSGSGGQVTVYGHFIREY